MSKRRNPPETPEPSKLRRPLADAEAMLDKQIARGEAIAAGLRRGELPPEARQWDDENAAILERLFTGPESTEYKNSIVVVSIDYGDDDETPWHHTRLEWLRSLRARLYVYEIIGPVPAVAVDAGDGRAPAHRGEATQPVIFISHISEEAPLAHVLKDWIESTFPGGCAVFVSSDPRDLPAGARWLDQIDQALGAARVLLVMCSPTSLTRPWINIETGCALMKRVPVVPICHSGQRRGQLPTPLSTFQAVEIESPSFVNDFLTSLAKHLQMGGVPRIDAGAMRAALDRACRECQRPNGTAATPPVEAELDDRDLRLLKVMAEHDDPGFSADNLGTACGTTKSRAQYHLDRLLAEKLVYRQLFMGAPAQYRLSAAGRKYLVDMGTL